jgi:hypothetical protein
MHTSWPQIAYYTNPHVLHFNPVAVKTDTSSLDFFGSHFFHCFSSAEWLELLSSQVYGCLMFKGLFLLPLPGYLTISVFLPLSQELTECFERSLLSRPVNVLVLLVNACWLHFSLDWYCVLEENISVLSFGWLVCARWTRYRRNSLSLLWQNSGTWHHHVYDSVGEW